MSDTVLSWWLFLRVLAMINIAAWALAAVALHRRGASLSAEDHASRHAQLMLSAVYVLGCAFRCALPVYDIPRIGLVDSWLSSVAVGRSIATAAELCFAAQWALMLRQTARVTGNVVARNISLFIVPLIVIAEICSWYAVLTTMNLGHVMENSLWGLSAALVVIALLTTMPQCPSSRRTVLAVWCVAGIGFVAFIFLIDVPTYWARWVADEASGKHYLSVAQGLLDVATHRVLSHRWEDWRNEIAWMSLYFSVGVWASISLVHIPTPGALRGNSEALVHTSQRNIVSQ